MRPSRLSCAAAMSAVVLAFAVPALAQETSPQNNAEMAAIFAADQAVRQNLTPDFFKDRARVTAMLAEDAARRVQTRALLDAGALSTGEDYRAAAFVFQHGSTPEAYLLAHRLAVAAVPTASPDGPWIAAPTPARHPPTPDTPPIHRTPTPKPTPLPPIATMTYGHIPG